MARKKKETAEPQSVLYYFYTQERWDNWLKTLEEMSFEEDPESEDMPEGLHSLNNFTEDINVSVLKIVKLFQNGSYSAPTATEKLNEVEAIIMGPIPDSEIADIIAGVQMRFLVLFAACKKLFEGSASGEIKDLVKDGRALGDEKAEESLEVAATIGALVLDGGSCCGKYLRGDFEEPCLFDDWLIEVDEMGTAMKTLKNFEEQFGEGI
ncbi:hypothetical protein AZH53_05595 [Methanomicrobiaceae archaeon CYW5]|uniref:DUF2150 family protein n=1 Tax=Methanovulcanius yangii TaxID=1789227 RepID=UPI0029C9BF17|nr:DUF2150 family protein [Methanovulcanius yangii]MBT8507886.1 hypothetical protein [Methanovulcanius yangii]